MQPTALVALVRKDLQIFFTDRRAVVLTLAIPIAIASFFGFVFAGQSSDRSVAKVNLAIVDRDQSAVSRTLVANTSADAALAVTQLSIEEARAAVRAGRIPVAVVIPVGFGTAAARAFFASGARPQLELLTDPSKASEVSMIKGLLTGHVMEAVSQEVFTGPEGRRMVDESLASLTNSGMPDAQRRLLRNLLESVQALYRSGQSADTAPPRRPLSVPFELRESAVTGNPLTQYNGYAHAFAGMGIQFALFAAIELATGILLERERGLWKRLRSAPLARTTLLVARGISGTLLTLLTLLTSFAFAVVVFQVPIANPVGFAGVIVASAVMASTVGLLVAAIGHTPAATRRVSIFVVLVMVMLGGAWVPLFIFPAWLRQLTVVVPVRWAVDGLDAMTWRGLGLRDALAPIALLLAFSAVCAAAAVWRFRWEES